MSSMPVDEDHYPNPVVTRSRSGGLWRVVALAAAFIIVAVAISTMGQYIPSDAILILVGLLAVVGVFCLFAITAGILRFSAHTEETRTLSRAVVDSLPFGALVADRDGKISYANAQYGELAGGISDGIPVGVPRLFAGQPEASEALYRLSRAARDGRPASEDLRLLGGLGPAGASGKPNWYRVAVRTLPQVDGISRPLVLWTVEDITRDRERQDNAFLELQRAIDYLDHAPAGFFAAD